MAGLAEAARAAARAASGSGAAARAAARAEAARAVATEAEAREAVGRAGATVGAARAEAARAAAARAAGTAAAARAGEGTGAGSRDADRAAAVFDFCREISEFYRRDFQLTFDMMGKGVASFKLRTSDHVQLSYPLHKKLFKRLLFLCYLARDAAPLNLLCRRCPQGQAPSPAHQPPRWRWQGRGEDLGELFLQILHFERSSSLFECLKHTL